MHAHTPPGPGVVAVHMTFFPPPAGVPENTTFVNVVDPGPVAPGFADRVSWSDEIVAPALGLTQVPSRTRLADVGAAVGGGEDGGVADPTGRRDDPVDAVALGATVPDEGDGEAGAEPHAATTAETTTAASVQAPRRFMVAL